MASTIKIPEDFGSGGKGLAPTGAHGDPSLRDILQDLQAAAGSTLELTWSPSNLAGDTKSRFTGGGLLAPTDGTGGFFDAFAIARTAADADVPVIFRIQSEHSPVLGAADGIGSSAPFAVVPLPTGNEPASWTSVDGRWNFRGIEIRDSIPKGFSSAATRATYMKFVSGAGIYAPTSWNNYFLQVIRHPADTGIVPVMITDAGAELSGFGTRFIPMAGAGAVVIADPVSPFAFLDQNHWGGLGGVDGLGSTGLAQSADIALDANGVFFVVLWREGYVLANSIGDSAGGGFIDLRRMGDGATWSRYGNSQPYFPSLPDDTGISCMQWGPQLMHIGQGRSVSMPRKIITAADSPYTAQLNETVLVNPADGDVDVIAPFGFPANQELLRVIDVGLAAATNRIRVLPTPGGNKHNREIVTGSLSYVADDGSGNSEITGADFSNVPAGATVKVTGTVSNNGTYVANIAGTGTDLQLTGIVLAAEGPVTSTLTSNGTIVDVDDTIAEAAFYDLVNNGERLTLGADAGGGSQGRGNWFIVDRLIPPGPAYTRDAVVVEDRTLLASASATATNNNNVLAALIADLKRSKQIT